MSRHQLSPTPSEQPSSQRPRARPSTPRGFASGRPGPADSAAGASAAPQAAGAWLPDPSAAEVLLVTGYDFLQGEVEQIVAAAGGQLRVVADVADAAKYWDSAAAVLVGSDVRELPPRRRAPAVLVGLNGEGDSLWHLAAALGAERVAVLPDASAWLAEYLSRSRSPEAGGLVLGVTGGCGGAGATTAAIWIAQAAAGLGVRVLLVDGDPWGGGLELALAAEETPGLRWPDLAEASGSIDPEQLADSLPVAGGFSFLSWPGSRDRPAPVDATAAGGVLDAARRGYELVVVDIGRGAEPVHMLAWDCDRILVVVPAQLKAAVATARLLHELPPVEAALLVRGKAGAALDAGLIADAVGLPVQGRVPELRGVTAAGENGRLLDLGNRRSVRHFAASVLDLLAGDIPVGDLP
ncbi:septum site-determining protein Ssd [Pseudarthrobacter sulfonivorans]|uniref:septum site-determining protein Ssd n=1 Tax=Pseudarthrobacter sulfonivorans TaxID=121292 RepID=UPI0028655989|nr:septum site-determining protein Ssd [Pseudarthrobacter sulfonivorans]MDR6415078.1 secretion/DNA translocation related CpaE-like protein [Pseudarthrobacter sulfonivorans]